MKWTMAKIKKMSREEIISVIDKVKGVETIYTGATKQELTNQLIGLINKGLV